MTDKPMTVGELKKILNLYDDNLPVAYGSSEIFTGAKGAYSCFSERFCLNGYALREKLESDYIELLVIV